MNETDARVKGKRFASHVRNLHRLLINYEKLGDEQMSSSPGGRMRGEIHEQEEPDAPEVVFPLFNTYFSSPCFLP